jgi:hypothetical protein
MAVVGIALPRSSVAIPTLNTEGPAPGVTAVSPAPAGSARAEYDMAPGHGGGHPQPVHDGLIGDAQPVGPVYAASSLEPNGLISTRNPAQPDGPGRAPTCEAGQYATVSLRYSAHDPQCPAAVGSLSRLIPCANREIGQLAGTDALEGPPAGDRHQVPRLGSWTL